MSGFGRRIVEGEQPLAAVTTQAGSEVPAWAGGVGETKERVRRILMARLDTTAAAWMLRSDLETQVAQLVSEIANEIRVQLNEREEALLAFELVDDMLGLGPLEPLLNDDRITDILVNGPNEVFVERAGKLERSSVRFRDVAHLQNVAVRIAAAVGRRVDEASPMVDARLQDGSRVNIVLPPVVLNGGTISIRKFSRQALSLEVMARQQNLSPEMAKFLEVATRARLNILISGGTGSGKTTLMNAMSHYIEDAERVITIEDAVELRLQQPHLVQMETRIANIEGAGRLTQRDLLRNALRMRPDRIIIGEVRGDEAFDMLQAMNTGHDGSMSTIHANAPRDALLRLENMVLMAGTAPPLRAIRGQIASALNLIVQIERMHDGIRRIQSVVELVGMEGDVILTQTLFNFVPDGETPDGQIAGRFETARIRPHCLPKARLRRLEAQMLQAVGIER